MKTKFLIFVFGWLLSPTVLNAQATFSAPAGLCPNSSVILFANTGTLTNCTFTWSGIPNGIALTSINSPTTSVSLISSGVYTISLSVTSGTLTSNFQNTITSFPLPTITITQNNFTTCIASNSPLYSNPILLFATGGTSYTWNPQVAPLTGNPNGPSNTVRPATTSCFTVTGQNANGCTLTAVSCITVVPRFTINVSPSSTIVCRTPLNGPDELVKLTASNPSPPSNGLPSSHTYAWSGPSIVTPTVSATVYVVPFSTGSFTAEIRDSLGCVSLPAIANVSVISCTGLETNNNRNEHVSIYPNPTKGKIFLWRNNVDDPTSLSLYSLTGQKVKRFDELVTEIDLNEFPPGIYFLRVESTNGKFTYKVIKE